MSPARFPPCPPSCFERFRNPTAITHADSDPFSGATHIAMTLSPKTHVLARLGVGFRTDAVRLQELQRNLLVTLKGIRLLARMPGAPAEWMAAWEHRWSRLEGILSRLGDLVGSMDASIQQGDATSVAPALGLWGRIQDEEAQLAVELEALRVLAESLEPSRLADWNILARAIELHIQTHHACAQALRVKSVLLQRHSKADVDRMVEEVLLLLPHPAKAYAMDSQAHWEACRSAAAELEREHHQFLGFADVVKGLLMWVETTEERADRNLTAVAPAAA